MDEIQIEVRESMFVVDGGIDAELPEGSGGPVLAGPEALFVAGRVAADAPTLLRIGESGNQGELVLAYAGNLATPASLLRVVNVMGDLLAQVAVDGTICPVEIYLTDLEEPDEIFIGLVLR